MSHDGEFHILRGRTFSVATPSEKNKYCKPKEREEDHGLTWKSLLFDGLSKTIKTTKKL